MSAMRTETAKSGSAVPAELLALRDRIRAMPESARTELEPLIDDVVEHAKYRGRVMALAREGLQRYRLDLAAARLDLEATRREREALRARLGT